MKNWRTTLSGVLGAVLIVVADFLQRGVFDIKTIITAAAIAAIGILAKDLNVTGGNVPATDEASARLVNDTKDTAAGN